MDMPDDEACVAEAARLILQSDADDYRGTVASLAREMGATANQSAYRFCVSPRYHDTHCVT